VATIGKISVALVASTKPFERGMKRAQKTTKRFSASVAGMAGRLAKVGLVAGAAALGGIALLVRHQLKLIDATAKMSRALGISVASLQALRLAASLGGVGADQLDKGLKRMIKTVGDAARGLSTAKDALGTFGLDAEQLSGQRPDEIFKMIADRVKAAGNNVTTLTALMDIFGTRVGPEMISMLAQGRAGIEAIERETQALGLAMSGVDTAKVEAANDAWTRLKAIFTGIAQKITVELAPFITALVTKLVEVGSAGSTMGGFVTNAVEMIAKGIALTANVLQKFVLGWQILGDVGIDVVQLQIKGIRKIAEALEWVLDKLGIVDAGWTSAFDSIEAKVQEVEDSLKRGIADNLESIANGGWGKTITDGFDSIRRAAQEAAESVAGNTDEFNRMAEGLAEAATAMKKLQSAAERVFDATRTPMERFAKEMEKLKELFGKQLINEDTFKRAAQQAQDALDAATKSPVAKIAKAKTPRETMFQQVRSLRSVVVGGASRNVKSPTAQLQLEANNKLDRIRRQLERNERAPVLIKWD